MGIKIENLPVSVIKRAPHVHSTLKWTHHRTVYIEVYAEIFGIRKSLSQEETKSYDCLKLKTFKN